MSQGIVRLGRMGDDGRWRCPIVTTFAERLLELRIERDLTQGQLAEHLQLDRSAVSHWESGRRVPDAQTLQRLADYFSISLDFLLARDVVTKDPDPQVRALLRSMKGLTEVERQDVLNYIAWKKAQRQQKNQEPEREGELGRT